MNSELTIFLVAHKYDAIISELKIIFEFGSVSHSIGHNLKLSGFISQN